MNPNRDLGQPPSEAATLSLTEHDRAELASRAGVAGAFVTEGDVLAGRYELQGEIGSGGSSRVFRAYDRATKTAVAVKILIGRTAVGPDWMQRLGRELRLGRRGRHPNVCVVFDLMEADGCRFLTMELATEGTLRDTLRRLPDRDWKERIADARDVVAGTAALHADGIVHRDIKPENVLRRGDGHLVVSDFGLAVASDQTFMSGEGGAVGTPSYMAPEVALGGEATMASDVFALGVMLHEIHFGRRPEWETSTRGRFLKPSPGSKRSRVERSIALLCAECLESLAPKRPQHAGEVMKRFEQAVLGRYRSFKGALKAGKWGIVAGLVAAGAAAVGTAVLKRSGESAQASLVGESADWTRSARPVARLSGGRSCVYRTKDPAMIRVIWGQPPRGEEIDVRTGQVSQWPLALDMLSSRDCPQWTANGDAVVFNKDVDGRPQLMLSRQSDGSEAADLTQGYAPRWLPAGQEIAIGIDRRRAAVSNLHGFTTILPDAARPEESLYSISVNDAGTRIGVLYRDFRSNSSAVVIYEHPTGKLLRRLEVPMPAWTLNLQAGTDAAEMVVEEAGQQSLVKVADTALLSRIGTMGHSALVDSFQVAGGRLLSARRDTSSLMLTQPDSPVRTVAQSREFGRIALAPSDALVDRKTNEGRWLIARYQSASRRLTDLTSGPMDRDPMWMPGGKRFAYVVATATPVIRVCELRSPDRCDTFAADGGAARLGGVSPSGASLAFFSRTGVQIRLRSLRLADGSWDDLGPLPANCRLRWTEDDKLWIPEQSGGVASWVEIDVRGRQPTGRRDAGGALDDDGCPKVATSPSAPPLRLTRQVDAELLLVPEGRQ
jgi:serine/threonine protein kinase